MTMELKHLSNGRWAAYVVGEVETLSGGKTPLEACAAALEKQAYLATRRRFDDG